METNYPEVKNYIAGEFTKNGHKTLDVLCPLDGKIISTVPLSDKKDLDEAVKAAVAAYTKWSAIPIKERVQIFFRFFRCQFLAITNVYFGYNYSNHTRIIRIFDV